MGFSLKKRILAVSTMLTVLFSSCVIGSGAMLKANADPGPLIGNTAVKKPSEAGALQIVKKDGKATLCDKDGNPIQLRGMSTHGLQWYPEILNNNAFAALSNEWGCNVIRLAMYVGENGYATDTTLEDKVIEGIKLAKANNMYAIVDWHVLTPGDPTADVYKGASKFFKEIAAKFPNDPNVIYELCNEPNDGGAQGVPNDASGWKAVKGYAEPIIKDLRDAGNTNLVIVGSPNWSQRPDLAADDPIADTNTAYTVHFYSGTHETSDVSTNRDNVMSNARYALEHGVAVFASEWGDSNADGTGGPFLDKADTWLEFLNENNISWCNWSLSNKGETSAAFLPYVAGKQNATSLNPGDDKKWEVNELGVSGEYVRARIKGIAYEPIDRRAGAFSTINWNFNDGTTEGFAVNGDSPLKADTITVKAVDNALELSGLSASSDLSQGNYWANVRLSADATSDDHKISIKDVDKLSIDVYAAEPATVAIAAIPQGDACGWANPTNAVIVNPSDFTKVADGKYKATVKITDADSPSLKTIAQDSSKNIMTNLILFVGSSIDKISLDNITFSGAPAAEDTPDLSSPLGEVKFPSDFEDETRQGWAFAPESGVQGPLIVEKLTDSKGLFWVTEYPSEKPTDAWASAPRLILSNANVKRGDSRYLTFDFYVDPVVATKGSLSINLCFAPPDLGYWAQCKDTFNIPLENYKTTISSSGENFNLYSVSFDLDKIADGKVIKPDTLLRDITIVVQDNGSDFAGIMGIDNVKFSQTAVEPSTDDNKTPSTDNKTPAANTDTAKTKNPPTGDTSSALPIVSIILVVGFAGATLIVSKKKTAAER